MTSVIFVLLLCRENILHWCHPEAGDGCSPNGLFAVWLMESQLPRQSCVGDPTPALAKAERTGIVQPGKEKL